MSLNNEYNIDNNEDNNIEIDNIKNLENNVKQNMNTIKLLNLDDTKLCKDMYDYDFSLEIKTTSKLSAKQYLLIIPITNFFKNGRNLFILYNILKCKSVISLRLIEYFVVNYVLDNNTYFNLTRYKKNTEYLIDNLFEIKKSWNEYNITHSKKETFHDLFMIHDNYKCKLKEYNKKNFDPFCRWQRIIMIYDKKIEMENNEIVNIYEKSFETTVAQLNFFKWIIENHIIDYIIENFNSINKSMNEFEKQIKNNKHNLLQQLIKNDNINHTNDNTNNTNDNTNNTNDNTKSSSIENITQLDNKGTQLDNPITQLDDKGTQLDNPITQLDSLDNVNLDLNLTNEEITTNELNIKNVDLQIIKKTRKKKEIVYCNADKKTNKKQRVKKEFTKTNRNIMKYNKEITLKFN